MLIYVNYFESHLKRRFICVKKMPLPANGGFAEFTGRVQD
ncbi:hypothetical protein Cabys_1923 [Caldithrix abyssi DSM 13497]|uniref:Uncharacterized protein n=1 Tax=Caldithrix abyssi DSM 13497 TaxID=880073 RepID=A0A1J1C9U3_CALAY|nr:hypothetical protein Cabys_1923 [Caldithrix abyssi DSM 13497]